MLHWQDLELLYRKYSPNSSTLAIFNTVGSEMSVVWLIFLAEKPAVRKHPRLIMAVFKVMDSHVVKARALMVRVFGLGS